MTSSKRLSVVIALGWFSLSLGCSAPDDAASGNDTSAGDNTSAAVETQTAALTAEDCDACVTAKACCEAVTDGPLCNVDAAACYAADPGRQATRIRWCRMLIRTTISAWQSAGRTPPPECQITW